MQESLALECNNAELTEYIGRFRKSRVVPLLRRELCADEARYTVAFVGLTNAGKSTLLQALLEAPVAPRRNGPATKRPITYQYSRIWSVEYFRNYKRVEQRFSSSTELSPVVEAIALQDPAVGDIADAVVTGPFSLLSDGLRIMDTPGTGSADSADVSHRSVEQWKSTIKDWPVHDFHFCISSTNSVVSEEELAAYQAICNRCSRVVVTKWDFSESPEEYRDRYQDLFQSSVLCFVDAKGYLKHGGDRHPTTIDTGVDALSKLIADASSPLKRKTLLNTDILDCAADLFRTLHERFSTRLCDIVPDDTWPRLCAAAKQSLNDLPIPEERMTIFSEMTR